MNIFEDINVGGPAFFRNNVYVYGGIEGAGGGGISLPYSAKTGAYTVTANDYVIHATTGTFTVTLPTAAGIAGKIYIIKNTGSGTVTVDGAGSETLDGVTTIRLLTGNSCITIQSNGTNWVVIGVISPVQMV